MLDLHHFDVFHAIMKTASATGAGTISAALGPPVRLRPATAKGPHWERP